MCNTLLVSKHGYFSSFLFFLRARQACNQMQFIYRNDTTSTDHDKVSSLVWDKTPFMVSLKGWIESISLRGEWAAFVWWKANSAGSSHKKGKCRFGLLRPNGRECVLWRDFTTGQIKTFSLFYSSPKDMQPCLLWVTFICSYFTISC